MNRLIHYLYVCNLIFPLFICTVNTVLNHGALLGILVLEITVGGGGFEASAPPLDTYIVSLSLATSLFSSLDEFYHNPKFLRTVLPRVISGVDEI